MSNNLERYEPRNDKLWNKRADGAIEARIYTVAGIVEVFTWPGDAQNPAFCKLQMFVHPHIYIRRLPRHYHERWIRRLAYRFSRDCKKASSVNM